MSSLCVVILTKNEEKNIGATIDNARLVTEEVLLVDSGSTDRTLAIAKEKGARVAFRAWDDDFAAQRNFALTQTTADWVLYLDADEHLNPELAEAVRRALQGTVPGGEDRQYVFRRKTVAFGRTYNHGAMAPDDVPRLFPRESVHWVHKVHERPVCELPSVVLPGYVEHYTYDSWHSWAEKANRYTSIWAEDQFARGKRVGGGTAVSHALAGFFKVLVLRAGFLDGWPGIYLCCCHGFYTLLKYMKLYECQQNDEENRRVRR
jgi:glycosyltransferase involved in cell wall biosynthesis